MLDDNKSVWEQDNGVVLNVEGSYHLEVNWDYIENELRKDEQVITDDWKGIPRGEDFRHFLFSQRPTIEIDTYGDLDHFDSSCIDVNYEMRVWVLKYFFNHDNNICDPTYTPKTREELPKINGNVLEVK